MSVVRVEVREHMVQDKRACGKQYKRGNKGSRTRTEMKGRVQMIHGDYERKRGSEWEEYRVQEREYSGCTEIGDETRTRRG